MSSPARHLGRLLLIATLLMSGGTHWLVLQSIAWTSMLVTRAQETSLSEAVRVTFDGAHPCALCRTIAAGRGDEQSKDRPPMAAKVELFYERQSTVLLLPLAREPWERPASLAGPRRAQPPASPPPQCLG